VNITDQDGSGFKDFLDTLLNLTERFSRPIVLAHGDFHILLIDMLRLVHWHANEVAENEGKKIPNLTRLQMVGATENHWINGRNKPSRRTSIQIEYKKNLSNQE
jgi:hypothetical protein